MTESAIFTQYEQEYTTLNNSITSKIESFTTTSPDQKKLLLNQLAREIEEGEEIIGTMEVELNTLPAPIRNNLNPRVKAYKDEMKKIKKNYSNLKSSTATERDQLLGENGGGFGQSQEQRSRVLDGTERLTQGSKRLEEARRVALDTEQIGIDTLADLNRQRQQLERVGDSLNTADSWIAKSQGVLKGMQRRLQTNKMLQYSLIGVLVIIILVVIFFRFFS